jgi:hypothetical protein
MWTYTSTPPYALMAQAQGQLYLYISLVSCYEWDWYLYIGYAVHTGTMKGFVPSFHGNELCIAVIKIVYHGSIFDEGF